MQTKSSSTIDVPPNPDVSPDAYRAVVAALSRNLRAREAAFEKEARRTERLGEAYQAAVIKFMGERKYKQLNEYCERAARSYATGLRASKGQALSDRNIRSLADQRREESLAFLSELGVDADAFNALQRRYNPSPMHPPPTPPRAKKYKKKARHVLRPWTTYRPPYAGGGCGSWRSYHGTLTTDDNGPSLFFVPASGNVGHRSTFYNGTNPSTDDGGSSSYHSGVGFWHTMSRTGLAEVQISAQAVVSRHHLHLEDYFGFSDSSVHQDNYITLLTITPEINTESSERISYIVESASNGVDVDWDITGNPTGTVRTVHLFSEAVFTAGTQVYVEVGSRSNMSVQLKRVGIDTSMEFSWFIQKVRIRSTAA